MQLLRNKQSVCAIISTPCQLSLIVLTNHEQKVARGSKRAETAWDQTSTSKMLTFIWPQLTLWSFPLCSQGTLCLLEHDEEYVFTLPCAYARSILTMPWVELGGKVTINCAKSGYSATVTFHTKPFYGGKVHRWVSLCVCVCVRERATSYRHKNTIYGWYLCKYGGMKNNLFCIIMVLKIWTQYKK